MKKRSLFRRGLIALLPILLTLGIFYWIVAFLFDKVGRPIGLLLMWILEGAGATAREVPFTYGLVGFLVGVLLVFLLGMFVATFLGHRFYRLLDAALHRLPIIRAVYPYAKQVTDYFVSGEKKFEFKNAVAVTSPTRGSWSIGFITTDGMRALNDATGQRLVGVFVPTSPTPFTGFVVFAPRQDIIPLPISVEEALRIVISCGILMPPGQSAGELRVMPPAGAYPLPPEPRP